MNRDSDNSNLILVGRNQFLLLFVSLSAIFSIAVGISMWDDIATYVVRFQFKSEVECKFGFNGEELVITDNYGSMHKYFVITHVEPSGEFEKAGLRKDDVVFANNTGCLFGQAVRSSEGILFSKLHYADNGDIIALTAINSESVKIHRFDNADFRKVSLRVQK
jgi:hypothetical protein